MGLLLSPLSNRIIHICLKYYFNQFIRKLHVKCYRRSYRHFIAQQSHLSPHFLYLFSLHKRLQGDSCVSIAYLYVSVWALVPLTLLDAQLYYMHNCSIQPRTVLSFFLDFLDLLFPCVLLKRSTYRQILSSSSLLN